jgi:putative transposase
MKQTHGIGLLCDAFCVSRSGYHQWLVRQRTPSPRASQDVELVLEILQIDRQSRGTYGTPRIQAELRRRGRNHGKKRLDRIRTSLGLAARQKRRFRPRTTDSNHDQPIAANRLLEMAAPCGADQVSC